MEPVTSTADIAGEWDIVRFDGYEPARLIGSTRASFVDFYERGISLQIECNNLSGPGVVSAGRFRAQAGNWLQTAVGCGAERHAREDALGAFMRDGPTVDRLADGRLFLRSGTTELVLERPAVRRLAYIPSVDELAGEWRLAGLTRFLPANGRYGIGLSEVAGRVILSGDRASFTRCPQFDLSIELTAEGILRKTGGPSLPANAASCKALATVDFFSADMPVPWDAMRVLHGDPLVEKAGKDEILLTSGDIGLLLTREPCGILGSLECPPR